MVVRRRVNARPPSRVALCPAEAGAYWIASRAIRHIFRAADGYKSRADATIPDTKRAHELMLDYFKVRPGAGAVRRAGWQGSLCAAQGKRYSAALRWPAPCPQVATREGMLDVFYKDFVKARVAGFTRVLAEGAWQWQQATGCSAAQTRPPALLAELSSPPLDMLAAALDGDAFCAAQFAAAGRHLGSMARTLAPHLLTADSAASADGVLDVHGLQIVCVGSVWKSWPLLRDAFVAAATAPFDAVPEAVRGKGTPGRVRSFRLVRLLETSAVGAAWRGAQLAGAHVPVDFAANSTELFSYAW